MHNRNGNYNKIYNLNILQETRKIKLIYNVSITKDKLNSSNT